PAAGIGYRIGAGLDGAQLDQARVAGEQARGAVEIGVDRRVVRVVRMDVLAGRVAVPDLDHRARQRRAVLVEHADAQARELAERALRAVPGEVALHRRQLVREVARTRQLGRAVRPA